MIPQGEDRRGWRINLGGHPRVGRGRSFFGQNRERGRRGRIGHNQYLRNKVGEFLERLNFHGLEDRLPGLDAAVLEAKISWV